LKPLANSSVPDLEEIRRKSYILSMTRKGTGGLLSNINFEMVGLGLNVIFQGMYKELYNRLRGNADLLASNLGQQLRDK
jgi:hypothetical protein